NEGRPLRIEDAGPEVPLRSCKSGSSVWAGQAPADDHRSAEHHNSDRGQHGPRRTPLAWSFQPLSLIRTRHRGRSQGKRCRLGKRLAEVKLRDVASFRNCENDRLILPFRGEVFLQAKAKEACLRTHNAVVAHVITLRAPEDNCADALFLDRMPTTLLLLLADETKKAGEAV